MSEPDLPSAASPSLAPRTFAVIVPALDEAENMRDLFLEMAETFRDSGRAGEIVLVDDGSSDGTLEAARAAARAAGLEDAAIFVQHRTNRGKTAAVLSGARASQADVLVLFDADLQHATDEVPRFLEMLESDPSTTWSPATRSGTTPSVSCRGSTTACLGSYSAFQQEILTP
jgi:glycosyltransferase involved in cell wall biosynthesis